MSRRTKSTALFLCHKKRCLYIFYNVLDQILNEKLKRIVHSMTNKEIEEVRLTVNAPVCITSSGKVFFSSVKVDFIDIEYVLNKVSRNSLYAVNDTMIKGYISYEGGIRVGLAGEYVYVNGKIKTIKNINSIVIRKPNEKYGLANKFINKILYNGVIRNTLFVGAPLSGKTTILREIARKLSSENGFKVVVIDEKNEISASFNGISYLDVGNSIVCAGSERVDGIENAVRNLSPQVIITDEIYGEIDKQCIERCLKSGVSVITSMHGNYQQKDLINLFDYCVGLSSSPIGEILWEEYND